MTMKHICQQLQHTCKSLVQAGRCMRSEVGKERCIPRYEVTGSEVRGAFPGMRSEVHSQV